MSEDRDEDRKIARDQALDEFLAANARSISQAQQVAQDVVTDRRIRIVARRMIGIMQDTQDVVSEERNTDMPVIKL